MRLSLLLLAAACAADAAVIKGIVLDNMTGRPLARTRVAITLLGRDRAVASTTSTSSSGQFEFNMLTAGWYLLSADRLGFATVRHGQKLWNSPGPPMHTGEDASTFLTLRMRRLGAITGTVLDENEVGLPQVDVLAYRIARPPILVGKVRADERGVYRIGLLEPGRYFIRTGPKRVSDDFNIVPTFHRETRRLEEAFPVEVRLDEHTIEVNVKPEPGELVNLEGVCAHPTANPVPVWLVSETGRLQTVTDSKGHFSFSGVAPGPYELFAGSETIEEAVSGSYRLRGENVVGAYTKLMLSRAREDVQVTLRPIPSLFFLVRTSNGGRIQPDNFKLWIRRKDLAGAQPARYFSTWGLRLPPGRWEARVETPPDMYLASVTTEFLRGAAPPTNAIGDGWTEFTAVENAVSVLHVRVAQNPAAISGKVTAPSGEAALGAPVYLEHWDEREGKRLGELRQTLTDALGTFRLRGLAPGSYRIVSSFDFDAPDEELMGNVQPKLIRVADGGSSEANLSLYVMP